MALYCKIRTIIVNVNHTVRFNITANDLTCKKRFNLGLNESLQRSCTVGRIVSGIDDMFLCCVGDLKLQLLILEALIQIGDQEIYDTVNVFLRERLVEYDLIKTVQELRAEAALE